MKRRIILFICLLMLSACSMSKSYELKEKTYCPVLPKIKRVVVLPFDEVRQSSLSIQKEGEIAPNAKEKLSTFTEDKLKELACFDVVTWEEVRVRIEQNGLSAIDDTKDPELAVRMKELFKADGVIKGYVSRYSDKIGGKYGVDRPASVSFHIFLYDTTDGSIIWSASYRETQTSLSENLFNIGLFFKRGFKWLSADEIAKFGIDEILRKMPGVTR